MKAEAAGETASPDGRIGPISLDKIAERASREKYQAPDTSLPIGATVGESLSLMRVSRDALNELRPRLEKADLSSVSYPHPAFGPLNLYEWLVMLGFHEERHLRQMDVVLSI